MKILRLYNWSDLHIDYNGYKSMVGMLNKIHIDPKFVNCLTIPGDLCNPFYEDVIPFFDFVSKKFDHTFYIAGNHEYYSYNNMTMNRIKEEIKNVVGKYVNVTFLDNSYVTKYGYTFVGTTLWSHVPDIDRTNVKNSLSDYYRIYIEDGTTVKNISVDDTNSFNKENLKFLTNVLSKDEKFVVMTHHAPLFGTKSTPTSHAKYHNSENLRAFHNNLKDMIKPPIVLWCYGHTHFNSIFKYNDVVLWTNQYGYNFENTPFNVNNYYELEIFN